jgi:hypothetical protein
MAFLSIDGSSANCDGGQGINRLTHLEKMITHPKNPLIETYLEVAILYMIPARNF